MVRIPKGEEFYNSIVSNCMESVIIFDSMGRILYANDIARRETGYNELITSQNILSVYPMAMSRKENEIQFDEPSGFLQTFAYRANQTCYPVKLKCMWYESEDSLFGVCFGVDDSERYDAVRAHKKTIEEAGEANKLKNEFTANITHELRTPINGIKGLAEGLAETDMVMEQAEIVRIIISYCNNMTKIINDILDFSKIEAGKLTIENKEFNIRRLLEDTLAFHSVKINEKGLKLIVDIDDEMPTYLIGDELRIGQILNNLLSNAVKFTSVGHIGLEVSSNYINNVETELLFMIIDSGIGIASEERDRLFLSFSQVDGSITRQFGGTGLGLAICRQLVDLMGGSIRVDSEKGKGSTFSFSVKLRIGQKKDEKGSFPVGKFVYERRVAPSRQKNDAPVTEITVNTAVPDLYSEDFETESEEREIQRNITDLAEKLKICIDLGNWDKAESFASVIRNLSQQKKREWKQTAFSLLLNVRKGDREKTVRLIERLEAFLAEEDV